MRTAGLWDLARSPMLLHRKAGSSAAYTVRVVTNHAGLVRAEHVLTARTKTNRSRRHEISDQRRANNWAGDQIELIAVLYEGQWAKTGENIVDETGLRNDTESGGSAPCSWATQRTQSGGEANLRKQSRVSNLSGVDQANRGSRGGLIRRYLRLQ